MTPTLSDQSTSAQGGASAPRPPVRESDIGPLLNDLRRVRDEREKLGEADGDLYRQEEAIKAKLRDYHETSGLNSLGNDAITVTFKEEIRAVPDKEKWDALYAWATQTGNTHIFKREIVSKRLVELSDSGVAMPDGISFTSYLNINVRRKNGGGNGKNNNSEPRE